MARFPGPNYNTLIEKDPQIVKIALETVEIGARNTAMPHGRTPQVPGSTGNAPTAPEMTIKHTS